MVSLFGRRRAKLLVLARKLVCRNRLVRHAGLREPRNSAEASFQPGLEGIHVRVKDGSEIERHELRKYEAADDR